ncbi:MAG TPA: glycosyltransferase family 4 protein [Acidimicrobiales bacterium]|nr:glycosyltransferase family 4 protein [Acidimicrobiales bacterium]
MTVATSTSGVASEAISTRGRRTVFGHRPRTFGRGRWHFDSLLSAGVAAGTATRAASRGARWDVAQCHNYPDAVALRVACAGRRPPYVLWLPGTARRGALRGQPLHRLTFRAAVRGAARVHALSDYAVSTVREELGIAAVAVPPGVRTEQYAGTKTADVTEPIVLCTASPGDVRKRVDLLVRAFPIVLRSVPGARLVLAPPSGSARLDEALGGLDAAALARVEVRPNVAIDDLAALYREAAVSVLPSIEEAFGLVIVESLAAGTPVVGAASGAIPEILGGHEAVGRLFAPDDVDALAGAILEGFELAEDRGTVAACREHARRWDWSVVGPQLERVYADIA